MQAIPRKESETMIPESDPQGLVHIGDTALTPLVWDGQRVVTFRQIDAVHQRPEGTARKAYNRHQNQFKEGTHAFVLQMDEAKNLGIAAPNGLVVLTQRGYLKLTKPFTDQLSWDMQDQLIERYFSSQSENRTGNDVGELVSVSEMAGMFQDPATVLAALQEMATKALALEGQVRELTPKAEFTDQVSGSHGSMTVKKLAQLCGTGQNRMFRWLRANGYLQKDNVPYQKHVDRGLFELRVLTVNQGDKTFTRTQPLVTGKGLVHLQHKFAGMVNTALELDANPGGWV